MKQGQASKTATIVCISRALADGDPSLPMFSDPTAWAFLSDSARARVERIRSGGEPRGIREALGDGFLSRQAKIMVARTVAIDDSVREARSPQVVILGAGLDGRAWRMRELADAVVFEVDHPDTQREKIARAALLTRTARDVRFVPVDFTRDALGDALEGAGHTPEVPTTWVWEGVVMYLDLAAIESTLAVIARRSAPGSRLIILYHRPTLFLPLVRPLFRRIGEPLRSSFRPDAMRRLLATYELEVVRDERVDQIARTMAIDLAAAAKVGKHLRIVTARRR